MAPRRALPDKLKIGGRVLPGETLVGSGRADDPGGSGLARWVLTTDADGVGHVTLGIGNATYGTRDDDAGPWRPTPSALAADNAERARLRAEYNAADDRLAEIDALARLDAVNAQRPTPATLEELNDERDRVNARLAEIRQHDMAVNAAHARSLAGEDVDPAELDPPPYCAPGEYQQLRDQAIALRDVPDLRTWAGQEMTPAAPGEVDTLSRRMDELEDIDISEVYPNGHTGRFGVDQVAELRTTLTVAVAAAEETHRQGMAWWDEKERLEAVHDSLRGVLDDNGMPRKWTDEEDALWDETAAALERHEAVRPADTEDSADYTVFAQGTVPGEWGDLAYRVELDDYGIGPQVMLGVLPHGDPSITTLDQLSETEATASMDPAAAWELIGDFDRVTQAATTGNVASPASAPAAASTTGGAPLPPMFTNVAEAWAEAVTKPMPADGAIRELGEWLGGWPAVLAHMSGALDDAVQQWRGTIPLAGLLLDHLAEVGESLGAAGDTSAQAVEEWLTAHAVAIARQEHPDPGQGMLNVR